MNIYDFSVKQTNGSDYSFSELKGKVFLIVNTASKCGFAPQFDGLEELYNKYKNSGFTVLGFPSDQFKQEPISDENMVGICKQEFGVTFPMLARVNVNGKNADPLYGFLKKQKSGLLGGSIKWNFTKFLIDAKGNVVKRYSPSTEPKAIEQDIKLLLKGMEV